MNGEWDYVAEGLQENLDVELGELVYGPNTSWTTQIRLRTYELGKFETVFLRGLDGFKCRQCHVPTKYRKQRGKR